MGLSRQETTTPPNPDLGLTSTLPCDERAELSMPAMHKYNATGTFVAKGSGSGSEWKGGSHTCGLRVMIYTG